MAKERIILLGDGELIYTLGAISDTSNDVLVLQYPLFKSGNSSMFEEKDLVSKMFDKETFSQLCLFNIMTTTELKRMRVPKQPYKLEIGSQVRFEKKPYDVIGFFYNTFAQLNIISPILFNYTEIVADVNALLFALKSNTEIEDIINKNIRERKYDNQLNFPFLVGISNFKEYFTKIVKPPFTTLETIIIKQDKREVKGGENIVPLNYNPKQLVEAQIRQELTDEWTDSNKEGNLFGSKSSWVQNFGRADGFENLPFYNRTAYEIDDYSKQVASNFRIITYNSLEKMKLPFEFFNAEDFSLKIQKNRYDLFYTTDVGRIPYLLRSLILISDDITRYQRPYNAVLGTDNFTPSIINIDEVYPSDEGTYNYNIIPERYNNFAIFELLFKNNAYLYINENTRGGYGTINDLLKETQLDRFGGTMQERTVLDSFEESNPDEDKSMFSKKRKTVQLILEENTYYGEYFISSGSPSNNSSNNEKILPFGSIVQISGVWWYILKYISTDINDLENLNMCLCAKASTRENVVRFSFGFERQTDFKGKFKFIETEKIYKASLKNKFLPNVPSELYSKAREGKTLVEKTSQKENIVSELFLEKRVEQLELLNKNFPKLNDTFVGILSVLDKKLRKPKQKIKKSNTENFVYCLVSNNRIVSGLESFDFQTNYGEREEQIGVARAILEQLNTKDLYNKLQTSKYISLIPKEILALSFSTFRFDMNNAVDSIFVFALENYQQYQQVCVTRNAGTFKFTSLLSEKIKLINKTNYGNEPNATRNYVTIKPKNSLNPLNSKYFFNHIPEPSVTSKVKDYGKQLVVNLYVRQDNSYYDNNVEWSVRTNKAFLKFDSFEFGQFSFVFSVLVLLFEHSESTALLHLEENAEEKVRNLPIVKFLQQFDLNTNLSTFKGGLKKVKFYNQNSSVNSGRGNNIRELIFPYDAGLTEGENIKQGYKKLEEKLKKGNSPFDKIEFEKVIDEYDYDIDIDQDDEYTEDTIMEAFIILIKQLDKVYFNVLDLSNKIKLNNRKLILQNFPKLEESIEEIEEDIFTEDEDIFDEALQELGDEFLDKELIEEIENIDISDF